MWSGFWLFALMSQGGYDVVDIEVTRPHPAIERTEYSVQAGDSPLNRFSITHVSRARGHHRRAPVVLLSPFPHPGAFYEASETQQYEGSVAAKLALDHHDVWLVDQRRTGLAPGDCETGVEDCSVMADWDFDTYSSDALLATALAAWKNPWRKPVVGGFSAGSNTALAVVNRAPNRFSGVFLYEGTFYSEDPEVIDHNVVKCAQLEGALGAGVFYDPSTALFSAVIGLAAADPSGLSPLGVFPPGTTNQQALLFVFGAPPPPEALSPTPNFIRMISDFESEVFVYSNQDRLTAVGPLFDNYGSLALMRDLACGLSGDDDSHYDNLDAFEGSVLAYVGGTGFGQSMFDTLDLMTNAKSIEVVDRPDLGEADFYFHQDWENVFYEPLATWLRHRGRRR